MDKIYFLCEFEYGGEGTFYQEIQDGQLLRLVNLDGSTLQPLDSYGYNIVNPNYISNLEFPQII